MQARPGSVILVQGGGTGVGVRAMIEGRADLCAASRNLTADEIEALYESRATLGVRTLVALDAIAVFVHPDNPIHDMSVEDLAAVFSAEIRNWAAVGGSDSAILPVLRPPTSGTHRFFKDHVLDGRPYAGHAVTVQRTSDVVQEISQQPQAIGYGGLAYTGAVRHLSISGVLPEHSTIRDGSYPLSRYLYLISAEPPTGAARRFVDWVTSEDGQAAVAEVGLIPLWRTP